MSVSIRTVLVALPTVYLLVALYYMNGSRTTRADFSSPQVRGCVARAPR